MTSEVGCHQPFSTSCQALGVRKVHFPLSAIAAVDAGVAPFVVTSLLPLLAPGFRCCL